MRPFWFSSPSSPSGNASETPEIEHFWHGDPLLPPDVNEFDLWTENYPEPIEPTDPEDFFKQDNEP